MTPIKASAGAMTWRKRISWRVLPVFLLLVVVCFVEFNGFNAVKTNAVRDGGVRSRLLETMRQRSFAASGGLPPSSAPAGAPRPDGRPAHEGSDYAADYEYSEHQPGQRDGITVDEGPAPSSLYGTSGGGRDGNASSKRDDDEGSGAAPSHQDQEAEGGSVPSETRGDPAEGEALPSSPPSPKTPQDSSSSPHAAEEVVASQEASSTASPPTAATSRPPAHPHQQPSGDPAHHPAPPPPSSHACSQEEGEGWMCTMTNLYSFKGQLYYLTPTPEGVAGGEVLTSGDSPLGGIFAPKFLKPQEFAALIEGNPLKTTSEALLWGGEGAVAVASAADAAVGTGVGNAMSAGEEFYTDLLRALPFLHRTLQRYRSTVSLDGRQEDIQIIEVWPPKELPGAGAGTTAVAEPPPPQQQQQRRQLRRRQQRDRSHQRSRAPRGAEVRASSSLGAGGAVIRRRLREEGEAGEKLAGWLREALGCLSSTDPLRTRRGEAEGGWASKAVRIETAVVGVPLPAPATNLDSDASRHQLAAWREALARCLGFDPGATPPLSPPSVLLLNKPYHHGPTLENEREVLLGLRDGYDGDANVTVVNPVGLSLRQLARLHAGATVAVALHADTDAPLASWLFLPRNGSAVQLIPRVKPDHQDRLAQGVLTESALRGVNDMVRVSLATPSPLSIKPRTEELALHPHWATLNSTQKVSFLEDWDCRRLPPALQDHPCSRLWLREYINLVPDPGAVKQAVDKALGEVHNKMGVPLKGALIPQVTTPVDLD